MKKIIQNVFTAILAMVSLIGGTIWAVKTEWDYEPTILMSVSFIELIAFIILRSASNTADKHPEQPSPNTSSNKKNVNEQNVNVNVSVGQQNAPIGGHERSEEKNAELPREKIIELMKSRVQILFIDDDKKFNIVQNLKDGGWKLTKTVEDIKNVDVPVVSKSNILFVDINGVGKLLNLEYEGLDLALMLKQRYPDKKIVIYSANKNSNSFHQAWNICDYRLEKNALPYQFQSLVESYSIELYKN